MIQFLFITLFFNKIAFNKTAFNKSSGKTAFYVYVMMPGA
jgi:hypothetical protein